MLDKVKALWSLFKAGQSVADPQKWKTHQITGTMVAALIIGLVQLLKAFHVDIPIDSEAATAIGAGVVAIVNVVFTITTSKTIGLPSAQSSVPCVQQSPAAPAKAEDVQEQPVSAVEHRSIDEETRKRAEQWRLQQSSNGLANDA